MPLNLKKDDMGDVIKDFYKSKAPQFKGKSKEKRREMAIAAKLTAERGPLPEYYGMPGGMGSSRSKDLRNDPDYQKSKDKVDSLLAAVRRGREKRKKMKEATDFKSRDKILKKAKPLHNHLYKNLHKGDTKGDVNEESNPRIPRKKGQPANSKKHSDLYTDENPKGTIHGLGFKDVATAKASVSKIRNSSRSHAHKIQAAVAMEQRAREMGKSSEAAVYRKYINSMKKKTKKMNEGYTSADNAERIKRYDADKKRFAKQDARMKFGKFYDKAKEAKDRLRPGEVKRYDKKLGKWVSNKES